MATIVPVPPTDLPPAPSTNDPENFDPRADTFVAAMQPWGQQLTTLGQVTYANANDSLNSAQASANNATVAQAAANTAALAANAAPFNPATNYVQYATAISLINLQSYRRKTAGVNATDPANDTVNWNPAVPAMKMPRMARNAGSNASLVLADNGKFVDVTGGTFTQTLDLAANLGDGWYVFYKNSGTGEVVIDPNGTETINGVSALLVQRGATLLLTCDGVAFTATLLQSATGYMKVSDQKASNTPGGLLSAGSFNARTLNTTDSNSINGAVLLANQVALPTGTYDFEGIVSSGPNVQRSASYLYNVTDGAYVLTGSRAPINGASHFVGRIVITAPKVFELRTFISTSVDANDAGSPVNSGQPEVYSQLEIRKVA